MIRNRVATSAGTAWRIPSESHGEFSGIGNHEQGANMDTTNTESIELGIIHLSDIHFSIGTNFIMKKFDSFYNALKDDFQNCNHIFIVVSGDVADKGSSPEYEIAFGFFDKLSENLKKRYESTNISFIIAPGNHDCNFLQDSQMRQNAVQNITYDKLGADNSVMENCIQIQTDFWDFFNLYNELPKNKAFYRITEEVNHKKICFHCFNTAWMSQVEEKPGSLFFPIKKIPELSQANDFDLNIAVFHHPLNWMNPSTPENNRKEFQSILDTISSLQIVGHEHENELRSSEDLDNPNSKTICATGEIFQDLKNHKVSGFQTFVINLDSNNFSLNRYQWKNDIYQKYAEKEYPLERKYTQILELQSSFISSLNKLDLLFPFENKIVTIPDLYVYPHIEHISIKSNEKIDDYVDSARLLEIAQEGTCVLEGESQIGKSSLLSRLLLASYEKGCYPILLNGSKLRNDNIEKSVKEVFKSQYIEKEGNYDRYRQLSKQKKALFIDDFDACHLSIETRKRLIENLEDIFGFVFLTIDTAYGLFPQSQSSFKNLNFYSIKPLGYVKRNLLVERYIKFRNSDSIENDEYFEKVRHTFDKLNNVMGDKLIPPYPVFLLTVLQALDYTPLNTNETSYGYCYQTLIHLALNDAGVTRDHIDGYINFITELAFEIFNKESKSISENEFQLFYFNYSKKFVAPSLPTINEKLLNSQILKNEFGEYKFGYIYIFYFLAAKKIAEMLDKDSGKPIVSFLFENLHIERNANILVFITHHTKNEKFIEEAILTSMSHFDSIAPITLEKNCKYYELLEEIVKEITTDVIEMRDPIQERKDRLIGEDKHELERKSKGIEADEIEDDIQLRPFIHAFRSIEIVGQIVKNRKLSLETATLKEMIAELYRTAFRMINYLGEQIKLGKNDLAHQVKEKVKNKDLNYDIERKVYRLLHFISLQACLVTFSKLVQHVGVKELHELFNEVANNINTPAAHLVSFSINSYYDKINIKELEKLSKELKDNYVAFQILRSRVKSYLYNNHVEYRLKQQIGICLKMHVPAEIGHKNQRI